MSEIQIVTNFELLPNEILIECFEYLNAVDIFYSFDQLNYRFNKLIRTTPLHLNCQYVRKSIFDQFRMEILSTPEIKRQIRSIHLSNSYTCVSIKTFLSFFPLDQFSHLRSLTLTGVTQNNIEQLKSMLPLIRELICFRLFESEYKTENLLFVVPISKLRTLTVPKMDPIFSLSDVILTIKNLTIVCCSLDKLYEIFRCVIMLQILNIQKILDHDWKYTDKCSTANYAINLKQMGIIIYNQNFDDLTALLKQTPNLKCLRIAADDNSDMIDAFRWEQLITSSLPRLTVFDSTSFVYWICII